MSRPLTLFFAKSRPFEGSSSPRRKLQRTSGSPTQPGTEKGVVAVEQLGGTEVSIIGTVQPSMATENLSCAQSALADCAPEQQEVVLDNRFAQKTSALCSHTLGASGPTERQSILWTYASVESLQDVFGCAETKKQGPVGSDVCNSDKGAANTAGTLCWGQFLGEPEFRFSLETPVSVDQCRQIYAFDFDSTLVKTKSGRVQPIDANDWEPYSSAIRERLHKIGKTRRGKMVIFSNQRGVTSNGIPIKVIQDRFHKALCYFGVPCQVFFAIDDDLFRKPRPGMWEFMVRYCNQNVLPDTSLSFFVGDAAGRCALGKKFKRDFSDTDYKLAVNIGLKFYTPEMFFDGVDDRKPSIYRGINPRELFRSDQTPYLLGPRDKLEVVLLVGPPGCGKSHFSFHRLPGYAHVNQDRLGTRQTCLKKTREHLTKGTGVSVVVDCQNRDRATRQSYIHLVNEVNRERERKSRELPPVTIRALLFDIPKDVCFHLNHFRSIIEPFWPKNTEYQVPQKVPSMVIHSYFKYFEPPQMSEGFCEIHTLSLKAFSPGPFFSTGAERLFHMFLS